MLIRRLPDIQGVTPYLLELNPADGIDHVRLFDVLRNLPEGDAVEGYKIRSEGREYSLYRTFSNEAHNTYGIQIKSGNDVVEEFQIGSDARGFLMTHAGGQDLADNNSIIYKAIRAVVKEESEREIDQLIDRMLVNALTEAEIGRLAELRLALRERDRQLVAENHNNLADLRRFPIAPWEGVEHVTNGKRNRLRLLKKYHSDTNKDVFANATFQRLEFVATMLDAAPEPVGMEEARYRPNIYRPRNIVDPNQRLQEEINIIRNEIRIANDVIRAREEERLRREEAERRQRAAADLAAREGSLRPQFNTLFRANRIFRDVNGRTTSLFFSRDVTLNVDGVDTRERSIKVLKNTDDVISSDRLKFSRERVSVTQDGTPIDDLDAKLAILRQYNASPGDQIAANTIYRNGNVGCFINDAGEIFKVEYDAPDSLGNRGPVRIDPFVEPIEWAFGVFSDLNPKGFEQARDEANAASLAEGIGEDGVVVVDIAGVLEKQNLVMNFRNLKQGFLDKLAQVSFEDDREYIFGVDPDRVTITQTGGVGPKVWEIVKGDSVYRIEFAVDGRSIDTIRFRDSGLGALFGDAGYSEPEADNIAQLGDILVQIPTRFDDICRLMQPEDVIAKTSDDGFVSYYQAKENPDGTRYVVKYSYNRSTGNVAPIEIRVIDYDNVDPEVRAAFRDFLNEFETYAVGNPAFPQVQPDEIKQQIFALVEQDPMHVRRDFGTEQYHSFGGRWYRYEGNTLRVIDNIGDESREPDIHELLIELNEIKNRQFQFGVHGDLNSKIKSGLIANIINTGRSEVDAIKIANQFLGFDAITGGLGTPAEPYVFRGVNRDVVGGLVAAGNPLENTLKAFARDRVDVFSHSPVAELKNLAGVFYELGINEDQEPLVPDNAQALVCYQGAMNGGCRAALDSVIRYYEGGIGLDPDDMELDDVEALEQCKDILPNLRRVLDKPDGIIRVNGEEITVQFGVGGFHVTKGGLDFRVGSSLEGYDAEDADQKRTILQIKFALLQEQAVAVQYGIIGARTWITPIVPALTVPALRDERQLFEDFSSITNPFTIEGEGAIPADGWPQYKITKVEGQVDKYDLKKQGDAGASYRIHFENGEVKITKRDSGNANSRAVTATVDDAIEFDRLRQNFTRLRNIGYGWDEPDRQQIIRDKLDQIPNNNTANDNRISFFYNGAEYFIKRDRNTNNFEIITGTQVLFQIEKNLEGTLVLNKTNPAGDGFVVVNDPADFLDATKILQSFRSPREILADIVAKIPSDTQIKVVDRSDPANNKDRYFITAKNEADQLTLKECNYADGIFVNTTTYNPAEVDLDNMDQLNRLLSPYYPDTANILPQRVAGSKNMAQLVNECRNMMFANHDVKKEGGVQATIFELDGEKYYVGGGPSSVMYRADQKLSFSDVLEVSGKLRNKEVQRIVDVANGGIALEEDETKQFIVNIEAALADDNRIAMRLAKGVTNKYNPELAGRIAVDFLGLDADADASKENIEAIYKGAPEGVKKVLREFAQHNVDGFSNDASNPRKRNLAGVFKEMGIHVDPVAPNPAEALSLYREASVVPAVVAPPSPAVATINKSALNNVIRCYRKGIGIDAAQKADYKAKGDVLDDLQWALEKNVAINGYTVVVSDAGFKLSKEGVSSDLIAIGDSVLPEKLDRHHVAALNNIKLQRSSARLQETMKETLDSFSESVARTPYWERALIGATAGPVAIGVALGVGGAAAVGGGVAAGAYYTGVGADRAATLAGVNYAQTPLNVEKRVNVARVGQDADFVDIATIITECAARGVRGEHVQNTGEADEIRKRYQVFEEKTVAQPLLHTKRYSLRRIDAQGNVIKTEPYFFINIDERDPANKKITRIEKRIEGVVDRNNSGVDLGSYSLNAEEQDNQNFEAVAGILGNLRNKKAFENEADVPSIADLRLLQNLDGANPADLNVRYKFKSAGDRRGEDYEITKESEGSYIIREIYADNTGEKKARDYARITITNEENGEMIDVVRVYRANDNHVLPAIDLANRNNGVADADQFWKIRNLMDGLAFREEVTKAEALFDDRLRAMEVDKEYPYTIAVADGNQPTPEYERKYYFVKTLDSKGNPTLHQYKRNADGVFTEVEKGKGFELPRDKLTQEDVAGSFKSWSAAAIGAGILRSDITNALNAPERAAPLFIDRNGAADDVDVLGYETVKIGKKKYNAYRVDDTLYVDDSFKNDNGDVKHLIKRVDSSITGKTLTELDGFETAKAVSDIISEVKRREVEVGVKETRDYLIGKIRQIMPIESEENKKAGDIVDAFLGLRKLQAGEEYPTHADSGLDNKVKKLLKSYADRLAHQEEGEHQVRNLEITEREFQSIHQINPSLRKHFVSVFYDNRAIDRQIGKDAAALKAESQALHNSYAIVNGNGEELRKEIYAQEAARGNIYAAKELAENLSGGNDKEKENGAFLKKALEIVGHNGLTTKQDSIQYQVSFEAYKGIVVKKFDKDGKESEVGRVVFNKSAEAGDESFEITPKSLKQVIQSLEQKSKLETVQDVELSTVETTMRSIAGIFNEKMSAEAKTLHKQEKQKTQVTRNQIQEGKIEEVKKDLIDNLSKIKPYTTPQVTDLVNKLLDNKNEVKPTVLSLQSTEFRKIFLDFVGKNAQVFANSEIDSFKDLAGQFYLGGVGVEVSHTKAQKCFQEASGAVINAQNELTFKPQGNGLAAYHLSLMYEKGSGEVAKNEAFAQSCLEEAAKKGVEVAKAKIAYKKFYGEGLEQNKTEAVRELKSISALNPEVLRIQSQIALDTADMRFAEEIYKKSKSILESKDPLVKKDDPALYEAMANTIRCGAEISTTKQEAHDRIVNLYSMGKNLGDLRCAKKIYEFTQSRTEVIDIFTKVVEAANTPNYSVNISGSKLKSGDYKVKSTSFGYEITLDGIGKDGFRLLSSGTVSEIKNGKIISSSMDDPSFVKLMQAITKVNELKAEESLNVGMELAAITKCIKEINFGNIAPELVAKDILGIRFISKSGMSLDGTSNVKCSSSGNFDDLLGDDSAGNPALIKAALTNLFTEKPGIQSHIIYKAIAGSAIHANFVGKMCRLGIMQNVDDPDNNPIRPTDAEISKKYFTKSAKSGNLEAEYNLAKLEADPNDKKTAIEKVAKKGFQPAIQDYADLQIKTPGQQDSKKLYYSALEKLSWYSQFKEGEKFATTDFEGKKLEFEISKYDEAKGFSLKIKRAGSHQFVDFATLSSLSSVETMSVKNFKGESFNALDANNANQLDVKILSKLVSEISAEKEQTNDREKQIQIRPSSSVYKPVASALGRAMNLVRSNYQ